MRAGQTDARDAAGPAGQEGLLAIEARRLREASPESMQWVEPVGATHATTGIAHRATLEAYEERAAHITTRMRDGDKWEMQMHEAKQDSEQTAREVAQCLNRTRMREDNITCATCCQFASVQLFGCS